MPLPVGASLLAKDVNDDAFNQGKRGACGFIASKLAPTGMRLFESGIAEGEQTLATVVPQITV